MPVAETANLLVKLDLGGNFQSQIGKATKSLRGLDSNIRQVGKGAGQLGRGIARVGTVGLVAMGGAIAYTAKQAIDFEEAFQGVIKTVDEADLKSAGLTFDDLSASIRKMSTEMPNSALELAGIAEQAGALGIKAKDIEAFTRQVAILASTTNVSADEAATALGQLQNVIGLTGDEFDNFAAALVDLGNKGASTEGQILEIARRSGASAKLIGIAKDETLGWAAAAANLGIQQELAGSSLQRFFLQSQNLVSSKGGLKGLAAIAGTTAKDFKKAFTKDASGAMESFLKGLGKMPKDARLKAVQDLFGKGSGMTRLILGLADSVDKNLTPSLDTSSKAWKEATAAQIEFEKRNATVRSSISRLHNVIVDAAITVGEGFAPALGRAANKLSEFLKQDSNRKQLKSLGEDIGKFIDEIDWKEVIDGGKTIVSVMRVAGDMGLRLLGIISKLPKELLAVGGGALVLNKLSGGLLGAGAGNVIAGLAGPLAKNLAASIPLFGRAFVQPVFVTNMGGFGGGTPGAGGGASALGLIGPAAAAAIGAQAATQAANADLSGRGIKDQFQTPGAGLFGIEASINNVAAAIRILQKPTPVAIKDASKADTRSTLQVEQAAKRGLAAVVAANAKVNTAVEKMRSKLSADLVGTTNAERETKREAAKGAAFGAQGITATRTGAAAIQATIRANRPVINVDVDVSATTVQKTVNTTVRYGSTVGSRSKASLAREFA